MRRILVITLGVSLLLACGSKAKPFVPAAGAATVYGIIRLPADSPIPMYGENDVGRLRPAGCPAVTEEDRMPVRRLPDGNASGVVVTVKGKFEETEPHYTHVVTLKDCMLTPSALAVARGDYIRVRNVSTQTFSIVLQGSDEQEVKTGVTATFRVRDTGHLILHCTDAGACGRVDVLAETHPFHAVSDATGHYRIKNVPPDSDLTLHTWHPLLKENEMRLTVKPNTDTEAQLLVWPASQR